MSEIKVGSEWVSEWVDSSSDYSKLKVMAIGKEKAFIEYNCGHEDVVPISWIIKFCKTAPVRRTVWLNVYPNDCTIWYTKEGADISTLSGLLFQQEVELIDPREGEKR